MKVGSLIAVASLVFTSGCATNVEKGLTAYNRGDFGQAVAQWSGPAQRGDPAAQHNLGMLWEQGFGSTPANVTMAATWYGKAASQGFVLSMVALARLQLANGYRTQAVNWLQLAARWNDQSAVAMLNQIREPVPAPDLFVQQQQTVAIQQQQALGQMGYALGCALAGGCNQAPPMRPTAPIDIKCQPTTFGTNSPNYRCRGK